MMTQLRMTEEEFLHLPQDGRKWDLVDGEAKEVPTSITHDMIVMNLGVRLHPYARGRGYLTASQAGFRMVNGNIRCPDAAFTRKERFPGGKPPNTFADFAPDLCIEIISPSEEPSEMRRKVAEYFASGAEQVWHLFPETQQILVFISLTEAKTYAPEEEISIGALLPGFQCRVSDLFALE
jgi:Uma2 family endonuclease